MTRSARRVGVGAASLLMLVVTLDAARPRSNDIAVTMTLGNAETDGVWSDGSGPYVHGAQNVRSVLVNNDWGNFVFDTNDDVAVDMGRRVTLRFPGAVPIQAPIQVDTFIGTIGVTGNAATDGNLRSLVDENGSLNRRMNMSWVSGNLKYSLRWNGLNGASYASFTCESDTMIDGATACAQWIAIGGHAGLYSIPTKGKSTETHVGTFAMPFTMTLDRQ